MLIYSIFENYLQRIISLLLFQKNIIHLDVLSIMLSYRNLRPPIWKKKEYYLSISGNFLKYAKMILKGNKYFFLLEKHFKPK